MKRNDYSKPKMILPNAMWYPRFHPPYSLVSYRFQLDGWGDSRLKYHCISCTEIVLDNLGHDFLADVTVHRRECLGDERHQE